MNETSTAIEYLSAIYSLKEPTWPSQLPTFEALTGAHLRRNLSQDDRRNLELTYIKLFDLQGRQMLLDAVCAGLLVVREPLKSTSEEVWKSLEYLHAIVATALWKYHIDIGSELEAIARKYDRLDDASIRARILGSSDTFGRI